MAFGPRTRIFSARRRNPARFFVAQQSANGIVDDLVGEQEKARARRFDQLSNIAIKGFLRKVDLEWKRYVSAQKLSVQADLQRMYPAFKTQFEEMAKEVLKTIPHLKGDAGYTPEKGKDYFDGKTPLPDVDFYSKQSTEKLIREGITQAFTGALTDLKKTGAKGKREAMSAFGKLLVQYLSPEKIARGIETLKGEKRLDYLALKNRPGFDIAEHNKKQTTIHRGGAKETYYYDLSDQCNGVLKVFTVPTNSRIVMVQSSDAPAGILRKTTDWTGSGTTTLTLTSEVAAPLAGSTLQILYVV